MNLTVLRIDCAKKQKKGIHIILASIFIWCIIFIVQLTNFPEDKKSLFVLGCTVLLLPMSYLISLFTDVEFHNRGNPLASLILFFSANQLLYMLIPVWMLSAAADKMLMVIAMIFGAHLLPLSWLYMSRAYLLFSMIIPAMALFIGMRFKLYVLVLVMIAMEILLGVLVINENRKLRKHYSLRNGNFHTDSGAGDYLMGDLMDE